jgi:hypothetical protein
MACYRVSFTFLTYFILSHVTELKTAFGLVTGFINHLQVVTTINYYTATDFHTLQTLHTNLFGLSALVFTELQHRNYNSLIELHTQNKAF